MSRAAQRPHRELYIRWMQEIRRFKPSTVSRRFSVTAGFYRTCVIDGLLEHSPAEHVRRPSVPWLQAGDCAASTVRSYATVAGEFLAFTGRRGGLAGLDAGVIGAFVATLAGYQAKTVEHKLCAVRSFLRFAGSDGLVNGAVLEAVPAAKSARQAKDPVGVGPG